MIDPLGFNYERMLRGEAQAEAGRFKPMSEVFADIRKRLTSAGEGEANPTPWPCDSAKGLDR